MPGARRISISSRFAGLISAQIVMCPYRSMASHSEYSKVETDRLPVYICVPANVTTAGRAGDRAAA